MLGILKNTFKPTLVQKVSRIKVYNALALQIILYGYKILILTKRIKNDCHILGKYFQKYRGVLLFGHEKE